MLRVVVSVFPAQLGLLQGDVAGGDGGGGGGGGDDEFGGEGVEDECCSGDAGDLVTDFERRMVRILERGSTQTMKTQVRTHPSIFTPSPSFAALYRNGSML